MSKPQKRKLGDTTDVDTTSCTPVKRIRRVIQIPDEMKIKYEQAKEAEEKLYSQPRKLAMATEAYFTIIKLLCLCISMLGVNTSLFYGAADILYCFFLSEKLVDHLPQLSDVVYACIVIASDLRGRGNMSREALLRLIFQKDRHNLRNRGITESKLADLVKKVRSVVEPQIQFLRWGAEFFLDYHSTMRDSARVKTVISVFASRSSFLKALSMINEAGRWLDSLKAITALDLAASLFGCTKMTSSWLPWTPEFDPRGGTLRRNERTVST
ncbi:hypothetical protein OS493_013133 [Desmophyllum pertusum]|uniref:Uncharacterized protein n=1 Tax=Desmophyllum pertusum TaxID=174260 RepID=A0A9W9YPY4_9CNID|nr:hypothetical protein OS493_013133 [Desmophyllum pertusum]